MKNLLIIGASGHSKVVSDTFDTEKINLLGYIDDYIPKGNKFMNKEIIFSTNELIEKINLNSTFICDINNKKYYFNDLYYFIAIGCNFVRNKIYQKLNKIINKKNFINIIHPSSIISKNVKLGNGIFVASGVIVNTDSFIGDFSIINTKASVDHDSHIGKFASINPGVTTGGNVKIGDFSVLGIQSSIKHNVKIGENCIIGASSYVHNDIEDNTLAYGTPAKFIKKREFGEKYL